MVGKNQTWRAVFVLFALGCVPPAQAGPLGPCSSADCPQPSYSRLNYWAPSLARLQAHHRGTGISLHAPDRYPDLPLNYQTIVFPCPAVDPATMYHVPNPSH